ncbi:MAG: hypothetical protein R2855_05940 [Thermomicrobiales bacterium]
MTDSNPVYFATVEAIDRFLDGRYNPAQLRSWLMVHFDIEHANQKSELLWGSVMMHLAVYNQGDFDRADLLASIRQLRDADNPFVENFRTPLGKQKAFRDIAFSPTPPWPIQRSLTLDELEAQRDLEGFSKI